MGFTNNLKVLCEHYPSIADVCRGIGINRTQFNKYLAGQVKPSQKNLERICVFFGVDEFEILMPGERFIDIIAYKGKEQVTEEVKTGLFLSKLAQLNKTRAPAIEKYSGYYYEYYYSLGYPGKIFKSLISLTMTESGMSYKRMERFTPEENSGRKIMHYMYFGNAINLGDRIFMMDYESITENEMTQTILFSSYKSQLKYLSGLKIGVSSRSQREPACTRVLYEYIGKQINFKKAFRLCGLFNEQIINENILKKIDNTLMRDEPVFWAIGD